MCVETLERWCIWTNVGLFFVLWTFARFAISAISRILFDWCCRARSSILSTEAT